jgi:subtilisin family serine protease
MHARSFLVPLLALLVTLTPHGLPAAARPADAPRADTGRLAEIERTTRARADAARSAAWSAVRSRTAGPMAALLADPRVDLVGLAPDGRPLVMTTHNLDAAITIGTDVVWPGGGTGLDLTGANAAGELALWDGGVVRATHQEFGGRATIIDTGAGLSNHATHVAGTMIAAGVDPEAKGMSYEGRVDSYFWDFDESEMAAAGAAGLRISNHSYGWVTGWIYGIGGNPAWYWFGDPALSETEDPGFGYYAGGTAEWDQIAYAAPQYLIVKSAGNDRDDAGPAVGESHFVWDGEINDWVSSTTARLPDGGLDGFDSIPYRGNAKNILTVGAVSDIAGGWSAPSDVQMSTFSGWGPTDDGRIKPDLVANGISLYSPLAGSDSDYARYTGTSMSAPSVAGSLNLVRVQYEALTGQPPRASTLKALAIHTASEAGTAPGPDYTHGWGLMNTAAAALLVDDHAAGAERIVEGLLGSDQVDTYELYHDGTGELKVTLVWTDPAGTPPAYTIDPPTRMLVNDLELRVVRVSDDTTFLPWVLDPAAPAAPATTGDNDRDNVEQVDASGAGAGVYRIEVRHDGLLTFGSQAYSLVHSGLVPNTTSVATPRAGARLLAAAPNPFNPRTEVSFALDRAGEARVEVFDPRGRRIAVLHEGALPAGEHRVAWDGRADGGAPVAAGVYLVRLQAGGQRDLLRVALVK